MPADSADSADSDGSACAALARRLSCAASATRGARSSALAVWAVTWATAWVLAGANARVAAAAPDKPKPPCAGCTLDVYGDRRAPMPLLVVLHGDREQASTAASRWRAAAKQRGWALLSLQCPASEKCGASWWQWNGDPQWVRDRVTEVAAQVSIDRDRTYVAGWSGGATYLGLRAPAWHDTFAAVVIHGGGMAPREESPACPALALPAYFLVGSGNPLHGLARDLRDYFTGCKQEVEWALIPGADHAKEALALDARRAAAILDWLAARSRAKDHESTPRR